ncbi:hypothetical protein QSH18_15740 [Xanthomonas sp. NCPPB 2654]|uniref:hypothetical protein n=1 Tax=unclassified Xanthomonas TaxID=2643310 RepID=UPI0021E0006E|nr:MULTISPECIES: hypothetical protein [unclassified Xanthomonas]MDL5367062.1 hypothetical protein [Xanthomonas sp. NCPPB 2654]UYC20630.1 hypothetical protein NUG20_21305 [Xanthomonas sp. CFBP 8443]
MTMSQWMTYSRGARIKRLAPLLIGVLAAPAAHALNAAQWQAVAPAIQAAVECRAKPDTASAAWKALPRDGHGGIGPITPPAPFAVFGLPVQAVSIFIDPNGELGESYTADLGASAAAARKSAKLGANGRTTKMGDLTLSEESPPKLTCTVAGSYDESGYQEN